MKTITGALVIAVAFTAAVSAFGECPKDAKGCPLEDGCCSVDADFCILDSDSCPSDSLFCPLNGNSARNKLLNPFMGVSWSKGMEL